MRKKRGDRSKTEWFVKASTNPPPVCGCGLLSLPVQVERSVPAATASYGQLFLEDASARPSQIEPRIRSRSAKFMLNSKLASSDAAICATRGWCLRDPWRPSLRWKELSPTATPIFKACAVPDGGRHCEWHRIQSTDECRLDPCD